MSRHSTATLLAFASILSAASAQSLMQQYGEVVQASDQNVAALPGVTLATSASHSIPVIDLDGNILWRGKLAGAGITAANDYALFYGRNGDDMALLFQEGDAEPSGTWPGVTTVSSTQWDNHRISPENGFFVFGSTLTGTGISTINDTVVYWGQVGGGTAILLQEGVTTAPSGGAVVTGTQSAALAQALITSGGTAIVKTKFAGGDVGVFNGVSTWGDDALLIGTPGSLDWLCREGDFVNGAQQVVGSLTFFGSSGSVQMDSLGRVLFPQALSTTEGLAPATAADDAALLLFTPGSGLTTLIREGDAAADTNPPLAEGNLYGTLTIGRVALSQKNGHVTFMSNMTGGTVTGSSDDLAVFAGTIGGTFTRIARETDPAPGIPGAVISAFFPSNGPSINDNGTVVFCAQLANTAGGLYDDVAVFRAVPPYGPGDITRIVQEGDAVAGLPAGWTIGNTNGGGMSSSGTLTMINDRDCVLINVAGVGDATQANWGVPATISWDPQHGARALFVQGDTFTVDAQPWTSSAAAGFQSTSFASGDGSHCQFNNHGDVVVKLFNGSLNAVVRGHIGGMISEPASVPAAGGVAYNFHLDCGPGHANEFYLILASGSGSRPGFVNPLNFGQVVPLNPDFWTDASLNLSNTVVWQSTFWFTDANGTATAAFQLPAGLPGALGLGLHHAAVLFDLSLTGTFVTEPSKVRHY